MFSYKNYQMPAEFSIMLDYYASQIDNYANKSFLLSVLGDFLQNIVF